MQICSDGHSNIVYDEAIEKVCPLCRKIEDYITVLDWVTERNDEIKEYKESLEVLREQVKELEQTIREQDREIELMNEG